MAYIGKSIESGTFSVLDTSGNTYNGSNTTFNLGTQVGSAAQLLVSHDGVIQKPGTDYTLASGGTQITFTTAPASGASIFIVEISGAVGGPLDSDLNGTELILDTDGDTSIHADTDDQIDFKVANADQIKLTDGVLAPSTDNDIDLGTSSLEFKDAYFDGTVTSDGGTFDTLGIGSAKDLGVGLHIKTADCGGGTPGGGRDNLIIEDSGSTGMTIIGGASNDIGIAFGDSGNASIGMINYNNSSNYMQFNTNDAERMRIDSSGNLFLGVTSASGFNGSTFKVPDGFSVYRNTSTGGNGVLLFYSDANSTGGNVGYFTANGGLANYQSNNVNLSDERLKKDIVDCPSTWDKIKSLKVRNFKYKEDNDERVVTGLIAQETETVDSNLVNSTNGLYGREEEQKDGKFKQIYTTDLYHQMLKALQESQTRIEALEARVTTLEG